MSSVIFESHPPQDVVFAVAQVVGNVAAADFFECAVVETSPRNPTGTGKSKLRGGVSGTGRRGFQKRSSAD
jgi:hypothetical protein